MIKGPGYFKLNNSLILEQDYQNKIKHSINETAEINKNSNPNTLWEIIKGNIRNETIKYASHKKKIEKQVEKETRNDIKKLEQQLSSPNNVNTTEHLNNMSKELEVKNKQLNDIIDKQINGSIIRAKALNVEFNEKNSKYFSSLERKQSESKIISQLNKNGKIITKQSEILEEQKEFYNKFYSEKERKPSKFNLLIIQ